MSARHFINDPDHLVLSALRSVTRTNPNVSLDAENKIIHRTSGGGKQVSLVSGGGSGHEPSFAAFVGDGILSAAVAGTIFASPSAEQVRRCILNRVDHEKGVLVIVMNYTGDVLNFGMAVEKAKASGLDVDMVVVGDDVGVGRAQGGKVGRRGIAGTVLVHKIAGALADTGASLADVSAVARLAADNVVSIGASLSHVHVPGRKDGVEELDLGQVEVGMGIHNEAGCEKVHADLPVLVQRLLRYLLDATDKDRAFVDFSNGDQVVLLINNLGGVSPLELAGITDEVVEQLDKDYSIMPVRIFSGAYMTSLNGLGFSITMLKLVDTSTPRSFLELLDAPAEAHGWIAPIVAKRTDRSDQGLLSEHDATAEARPSGLKFDLDRTKSALGHALQKVIEAEPEITKYDTVVGDGDCGIGLKRGAEAILDTVQRTNNSDAALFLDEVIPVVETAMDGTSGALYAIYLNALTAGLRSQPGGDLTVQGWAQAAKSALDNLGKYTPAKVGDRTLVDALTPFVERLEETGDVKQAAAAAEAGASKTKGMKASLGRTVYVGGDGWQQVPDPGAYGLAVFFNGLAEKL